LFFSEDKILNRLEKTTIQGSKFAACFRGISRLLK